MNTLKYIAFLSLFLAVFACYDTNENSNLSTKLYIQIEPERSGIHFNNLLAENDSINYFTYPYIYMGGGIAIGDLNNDGLQDLFFTGNLVDSKLYINKGNLKFDDITLKAGIKTQNKWCTGVTMVDVNSDGFLDIYISVSGFKDVDRSNMLFINNKDLTFTEEAENRGIADNGHSTQTTFFDYDNDGDLDAYIANYPQANFASSNAYYRFQINNIKFENSDKLLMNDGTGYFTDVTKKSGLLSYGLSLSATVGDFNQDGWQDIYVSNDFATPDYFYFNNGDGTFTNQLKEVTNHTSFYGMGVDVADFNNDGLLDFMQVDMTPEDNFRSKSNMASMNTDLFWDVVNSGFHYQYMQNVLQINNGINKDGLPIFSNVSQLGNMALTDWSWSPLFLDMDNDGWKDVYVTNGSKRDINNKDYFKKIAKITDSTKRMDFFKLSSEIPSTKIANYAFLNNQDLSFRKASKEIGLDFEGFSNGSAYGDLDNDGDLDLVVNNIDTASLIFENKSNEISNNSYLRFKPNGPKNNTFGFGLSITIYLGSKIQFQELTLTRGFQSSVEPIIHFGTGEAKQIDKAKITWPDGKEQIIKQIKTNQIITVDYDNAVNPNSKINSSGAKPFLTSITNRSDLEFIHQENKYNDYLIQPLLPHKLSQMGPFITHGDINNDGLDDFFIGGASNQEGQLFIQNKEGFFSKIDGPWQADALYEDMGILFFDADLDQDIDLYIVSGGNSLALLDSGYQDRLYLNSGNGEFVKAKDALPIMKTSGLSVVASDFDKDGDLDLFVGGRIIPSKYPLPPRSYLLRNDTKNGIPVFTDITEKIAPELLNPGLVTAALWMDIDNDNDEDLIITGEWMPITVFENEKGNFKNVTADYGLDNSTGWWSSLIAEDFDNDGDKDLVVGNLGLNYKYKASNEESFDIYAFDFDKNNRLDIVLGYYYEGEQYPVRGRECSSEQIPAIQYKFKDYNTFANATLEDVYSKQNLKASVHYKVKNFASSYVENLGNKKFKITTLPNEAQISSINSILADDFNNDGYLDLLTVGNLFVSEIETPRNDASIGLIMLGDGQGNFNPQLLKESGLIAPKDAKSSIIINTKLGKLLLITNNNDILQVFLVNSKNDESKK
ncbi:MAG: VCBS repeat-containing protein [Flavobacteriaceae bacterium]|nr:VCBS repeat-containing protein [Flavobacteriaceae bacterium]